MSINYSNCEPQGPSRPVNPFTGQDEDTRPAVAAFPMGRARYLVRTGVVVSDFGKLSYPIQGNVLRLITIL